MDVLDVLAQALHDVRSFVPAWEEDDVFWAVCGAVLKWTESYGNEPTKELLAAIQALVKHEMQKEKGTHE